jgi:enoyl-CoA hydratase/carnithine racemase
MLVEVKTAIENQLAVFTLSREKALNSLTHSMIKTIHWHAYHWSQRDDIACFLFPMLQQKVYCAGGDIRWLYEQGKAGFHDRQMTFFADEYRLDYAMGQFSKPVVAIVDGFLIGGGMGLLMPANTIYATEKAMFAMPETGIGFFPDVGMSYRLSQCPGFTGLYLALTGQRMNAHDAHYLGLVGGVLEDDVALQIQTMAKENGTDKAIYQMLTTALSDKSQKGEAPIALLRDRIDTVFSKGSVEEMIEALGKMSDAWAQQTLNQLNNACPLSLRVTFDLMKKVRDGDQASTYQLDHTVAYHFMRCADFYEGVRAQVIDKDKKPRWQFGQIADIPQSVIDQFFVCPDLPLNLDY